MWRATGRYPAISSPRSRSRRGWPTGSAARVGEQRNQVLVPGAATRPLHHRAFLSGTGCLPGDGRARASCRGFDRRHSGPGDGHPRGLSGRCRHGSLGQLSAKWPRCWRSLGKDAELVVWSAERSRRPRTGRRQECASRAGPAKPARAAGGGALDPTRSGRSTTSSPRATGWSCVRRAPASRSRSSASRLAARGRLHRDVHLPHRGRTRRGGLTQRR
jgi:hypothetical protein